MKVLFVSGGLPHYFNKMVNKINAHPEIEVMVIAPSKKGMTLANGVYETEMGVNFKIIRLKEYKTFYGKPFFKGFKEIIKHEQPDIIIAGWPYFLAFIFKFKLLLFLKQKKIKLVGREIPFTVPAFNESLTDFTNRSAESQKEERIFSSRLVFWLHKLIRKYLYSLVFDHSLLYINSGADIINSYGLDRSKITVTLNSPDTDAIFETINEVKLKYPELKKEPYRLLHIGRLVKWKNVDLLIKAVEILKKKYPFIQLAIIGEGEEESNLKEMVRVMHLEKEVKFLGAIYEGEKQTIEMLRSQVYVLAGMGGLSINEAMAHALPIVCSIADGTEKHLVFEGLNGFYFKDNDLDSLIAVLDKIFTSDTVTMGYASLDIIRNKINMQTVSEKYIEAILSLKGN
jgi:glycosyltransferase involved in cell wall biosynthesis